ncbi:hypothetical protein HK100_004102, partial [Physocladia obscura]
MHPQVLKLAEELESLGFEFPSAKTSKIAGRNTLVIYKNGSDELQSKLEWLFDVDPQALPFLRWLSNSFNNPLQPAIDPLDSILPWNTHGEKLEPFGFSVLSEDELLAYEELLPLFADEIQEYSTNIEFYAESDPDIEFGQLLLDEIEALTQELNDLEQYSKTIRLHETSLMQTKVEIESKIAKCTQEDELVTQQIMKQDTILQNYSIKVDIAMKELYEVVNEYFEISGCDTMDNMKRNLQFLIDPKNCFLYQASADLSAFMRADENLSENLVTYYESKFNKEKGSEPKDSSHFSYAPVQARKEIVAEMNRLTEIAAIKTYSQSSQAIQFAMKSAIETNLPNLWIEVAEQSVKAPILKTDYEGKILRFKTLFRDLQNFIETLLHQQSRHQFLAIAFETEINFIKRVAHILESLATELEMKKKSVEVRMKWYKSPDFAMDKLPNRVIDGRDELMREIMQLLEIGGNGNEYQHAGAVIFTSIDSVIEKAKSLTDEIKKAEASAKMADEIKCRLSNALTSCTNKLLTVLHQFTSTAAYIHAPK